MLRADNSPHQSTGCRRSSDKKMTCSITYSFYLVSSCLKKRDTTKQPTNDHESDTLRVQDQIGRQWSFKSRASSRSNPRSINFPLAFWFVDRNRRLLLHRSLLVIDWVVNFSLLQIKSKLEGGWRRKFKSNSLLLSGPDWIETPPTLPVTNKLANEFVSVVWIYWR